MQSVSSTDPQYCRRCATGNHCNNFREWRDKVWNCWSQFFQDDAFGGRGLQRPHMFFTDDTTSERQAIHTAFLLVRTVHSMLPHSAEMCFIDSTGNLDRHGCRVFVLLTHCVAGGVPLGIIVTTSESEEIICEGLELLKSILPDDAFRGCGLQGLHMFLNRRFYIRETSNS